MTGLRAREPVPAPEEVAPADASPGEGAEPAARVRFRWLRVVAYVAAGAQAVVLLSYSAHLYSHFDLTSDFAIMAQGWSEIARGHLLPYSTVNPHGYPHYGYPFLNDHFELVMWPLALLFFVYPHPIDLLVVQDLAIAGSSLVVVLFAADILERRWPTRRRRARSSPLAWGAGLVGLGLVAVVLADPFVYWTASFDFHIEVLATLFALLAARSLWAGQWRRAVVFAVLVALCGNVASTYLVALGISALLARRSLRLPGIALLAGGVGWAGLVGAVGGATGTLIGANYGYLAHAPADQKVGLAAIVKGAIEHPGTPLHVLRTRADVIRRWVEAAGLLGVVMPIGFGMALVVLLSNELNASLGFSTAVTSFQTFPVLCFVGVGTVEALVWLVRSRWRALRWLVAPVGVALLVGSGILSATWTPLAASGFLKVDTAAATQLAAAVVPRVPPDAEVVVSQGVIGRFADRRLVYPFLDIAGQGQQVPIFGGTVVFILTNQGIEENPPTGLQNAVAAVEHLDVQTISRSGGVYAFEWHPPAGVRSFTFPATAP